MSIDQEQLGRLVVAIIGFVVTTLTIIPPFITALRKRFETGTEQAKVTVQKEGLEVDNHRLVLRLAEQSVVNSLRISELEASLVEKEKQIVNVVVDYEARIDKLQTALNNERFAVLQLQNELRSLSNRLKEMEDVKSTNRGTAG